MINEQVNLAMFVKNLRQKNVPTISIWQLVVDGEKKQLTMQEANKFRNDDNYMSDSRTFLIFKKEN